MGKASRRRQALRQSARATGGRDLSTKPAPFVARPFAGLTGETDWVAMREVVPAATATVRFTLPAPAEGLSSETTAVEGPAPGATAAEEQAPGGTPGGTPGEPRDATIVTVLPMAWPGLHRGDGDLLVALQSGNASGDASRDVAQVLLAAAAAQPGTPVVNPPRSTAATVRLQDLIDTSVPFEVSVQDGFGFWVADVGDLDGEGAASLERANEAAVPTTKLESVDSAYWCRIGDRTHIRWVLPQEEDDATDALARLHAARTSSLGGGSRLLGAFRACGLLVPVWDLDPELTAADYEDAIAQLHRRLDDALGTSTPLSIEERRSRASLLGRQVTLR